VPKSFGPATPILDVLCPECQTVGDVELRKLGRPLSAVAGLIQLLRC
jgi:hypothetical protein